jgi:hypothetical protein
MFFIISSLYLQVLAGGAFDVGFNFVLSTSALGLSLIWWRLGSIAATYQWSNVFSYIYLPLSICLPAYASYVAWDFYYGTSIFLSGLTPVHYLILVGLGTIMRIVLCIVGCKMRYHENWKMTKEVLNRIQDVRR